MTEQACRPISFTEPMVREVTFDTKTQTRRVVRGDVDFHKRARFLRLGMHRGRFGAWFSMPDHPVPVFRVCPYGRPGDLLWVRETWAARWEYDDCKPSEIHPTRGTGKHNLAQPIYFRADGPDEFERKHPDTQHPHRGRWRPPMFMPRWASRLTLENNDVRVERVQEITEEDARAEGVEPLTGVAPDQRLPRLSGQRSDITQATHPYTVAFAVLWDTINAERGFEWIRNPWVWVIGFRRIVFPDGSVQ